MLYPLIARAVTVDETPFVEPSQTYGRLLVAKNNLPEAQNAPVRPVDEVLVRIAECESSGNLRAKNSESTATGKYQFLRGSWNYYGTKHWGSLKGKDIFSEKDQDDLARYVVSINGYKDWEASRHCWGVVQ